VHEPEPDQATVLSARPDQATAGTARPARTSLPGGSGGDGLVAQGLTKTFGPTMALRQVSAAFRRGLVHGLIGENGSGKSTFVKIVAGIHRADLGRVSLDGVAVAVSDGTVSGAVRISSVHQDGSLIEELTVGQNLDLIVEPALRGGPDERRSSSNDENGRWRRRLLDRFGLTDIDLGSRVADLPANAQRLVEIAAALARRPDVLLFDESTSVLDERGVAQVLASMREAAAQGACVIFVTHRLHEVLAVADDITVLRDGAVVAELPTADASTDELVRHMAGREVAAFHRREVSHAGAETVLRARGLRAPRCGPVDLDGRRGEIVGIAGAAGNGQAELIRALAGEGRRGGEVLVGDRALSRQEQAVKLGAVFVSADRRNESLSSLLSVRENYTIALRGGTGPWWSWLRRGPEARQATALADGYDLTRKSIEQPVSSLSGGNQQKVAIGRAVARKPAVLLVEEPTAGVDVRSRFSVYRSLVEVAGQGTTVVFTSTDASELRLLADRVVVLARGRQVAELHGDAVTEEAIVHAFSTATEHEVADEAVHHALGRRSRLLDQLTWTPATFVLLAVLLVALGGYAAARDRSFATMGNIGAILQLCLPLALVAMAEMPVLLTGEIDASLGSLMGLIVVLLSFLPGLPVPVAFLFAIAAGGVCGLLNAALVVGLRINAVIATIATLGVFLGIGEILRPTPGGQISLHLSAVVQHAVGQIPVLFLVAVVLAVVIDLGVNFTRIGLKARAVGYSAPRATQLGVRSHMFRAAMYVLAGLIAGLAGTVLAAQTGTGDPSVGSGYTLLSLAVPVIGGALLSGGRGSALGCLLGALFVAEVEDFIPFINLPTGGYLISVGALTVVALIVGTRHDLAPRAALARINPTGWTRSGRK
jgi:ribose transport system ATP-binding protein